MQNNTNAVSTVKYGKIEIPINSGASPYVPQAAGKFIDHRSEERRVGKECRL